MPELWCGGPWGTYMSKIHIGNGRVSCRAARSCLTCPRSWYWSTFLSSPHYHTLISWIMMLTVAALLHIMQFAANIGFLGPEIIRSHSDLVDSAIIHKLVPPVQQLGWLHQDGMKPLGNRAIILRCFEAVCFAFSIIGGFYDITFRHGWRKSCNRSSILESISMDERR